MKETDIRTFWDAHPCGDHIVGGLHERFGDDHERFFREYDAWRYRQEGHIPGCLDRFPWRGRQVLEIGLGQGAEAEQLIRRGAVWSGLDLTDEAVERTRARLTVRRLPFQDLRRGSATSIPWPDASFDMVFSHGVLHHVPDILAAQAEIRRVLRPGGVLVAMLYARSSLNYQVSIRVLRRLALLTAWPLRRTAPVRRSALLTGHVANAESVGLRRYLRMDSFVHRNTDGPQNPYAKVYDLRDVRADFPDFTLVESFRRYLHAPPLPVHRLGDGHRWGWHLWVVLRAGPPGPGDEATADRAPARRAKGQAQHG